jgi:hypothetical protein
MTIIICLQGGLGNQMFQYAAGRRLAHIRNSDFKLDITRLTHPSSIDPNVDPRSFHLGYFNIRTDFASQEEISQLTGDKLNKISKKIYKTWQNFAPSRWHRYISQHGPDTEDGIFQVASNVYLDGYWQSEKFFVDISDIIRNEYTLREELDPQNLEIADLIRSVDSIGVHFRRGDYISKPKTREFHGTCELSYYDQCIEFIAKKVSNPYLFIFSDDPDWVGKNFKCRFPFKVLNHNGSEKDYIDMQLMSFCKHFIIANSTFSWWGAWLGRHPQKIIIAPKDWFKTKQFDGSDVVPERWIRI